MAWVKLINSGSGAHLASVTASNGAIITGSLVMSGSISNVDYIDFRNPAPIPPHLEGRLYYDTSNVTLNVDTDISGYDIELGHTYVVRVSNQTGNIINKGTVVFLSGSQGNRPTIATASYINPELSDRTIGVVSTNISDNQIGYVVTTGYVKGIDTSMYQEGVLLYLSASGQYTDIKPIAPLHSVRIGNIIRSHATQGTIYINVDNGYQLEELHNVFTSSLSPGDLLQYSASGVWTNSKILTGSYQLTGSLDVSGAITSSLLGTSSYSDFSTSASFSRSSSNSLQSNTSISSSLAQTASYVLNAVSSSFANNSMTASFISTASYANNSLSSSYALTASYALNGGDQASTASYNQGMDFVLRNNQFIL